MRAFRVNQNKTAWVDEQDYLRVCRYSWQIDKGGYLKVNTRVKGKRVSILLHRFILGLSNPSVFVDHIDGNPLNNSRSNLRLCDNSQNQANRPANAFKKHGQYKGVFYRPKKKAWVSEISCRGKRFYLGFFRDEKKAALAYNKKALELFGEFALLNQTENQFRLAI